MRKQKGSVSKQAGKANRTVRHTVQTGLRVNELSPDWLELMRRQGNLARDWQLGFSRLASMGTEVFSATQRQAAELMGLASSTGQASTGLMEQALNVLRSPGMLMSPANWVEFWGTAMRVAQNNTLALVEMNRRTMGWWFQMAGAGGKA